MERCFRASRRYVARFALLVVLGLALALVTSSGSVASPPGTSSVSIAPKAYVYDFGFILEAQVTFQCSGGSGSLSMTVSQTAAQSGNGIGATGSTFFEPTNCDGTPHKLDVTIFAFSGLFDVGPATASATLFATSGTATDTRTIQIIHV